MENKFVTRRRALRVIGMTTGGLVLAGCSQDKAGVPQKKAEPMKKAEPKKEMAASAPAAGGDECSTGIDETSKKLRSTLQYVEKSVTAGKQCNNCLQYVVPEAGKACGGCKLFTGPVQSGGYCLSWAAKQT